MLLVDNSTMPRSYIRIGIFRILQLIMKFATKYPFRFRNRNFKLRFSVQQIRRHKLYDMELRPYEHNSIIKADIFNI